MPYKAGTQRRPTRILSIKLAVVEREVQAFVVVGAGFQWRFVFEVVHAEFSLRQVSPQNNTQRTFGSTSISQDRGI